MIQTRHFIILCLWIGLRLSPTLIGSDYSTKLVEEVMLTLDTDYTGLESAKKLIKAKKWKEAEEAVFQYFKIKFNHPPEPEVSDTDRSLADDALRHWIKGNKNYPPVYRGNPIDWFSKGKIDNKVIDDNEWLFQFHRLKWWASLGKCYGKDKNEAYFKEWLNQFNSYFKEILPITQNTPWAMRRGMEAYERCLNLTTALPYLIQSSSFNAEIMTKVLYFFHHQAEHIRTVYAEKGNHLLGELVAVYMNSLAFPEFIKAKEWKQEACERMPKFMEDNLYHDGMNKELVFSYHTMYLSLFNQFYDKLKENGDAELVPPEFLQRLERSHDMFVKMSLPDRTHPQFGDGWKHLYRNGEFIPRNQNIYGQYLKRYPNNPVMKYLSDREGFPMPKTANYAFPESGFYAIRSDWGADALALILKNGEKANFHNQYDNLSFVLSAYGKCFMSDSGCYIYSGNEEDTMQRNWFRSSKAHQTMTLDLQNAQRKPTPIYWKDSSKVTSLIVENQSYPELKQRRSVHRFENKVILIHDEMIGAAQGQVRVHFQLAPMPISIDVDNHKVISKNQQGPNITVQSFSPNSGMTLEKEKGQISYVYLMKEARPAWSLSFQKKGTKQIDVMTLIVPHEERAEGNWTVKQTPDGRGRKYRIQGGGKTYDLAVTGLQLSGKAWEWRKGSDGLSIKGINPPELTTKLRNVFDNIEKGKYKYALTRLKGSLSPIEQNKGTETTQHLDPANILYQYIIEEKVIPEIELMTQARKDEDLGRLKFLIKNFKTSFGVPKIVESQILDLKNYVNDPIKSEFAHPWITGKDKVKNMTSLWASFSAPNDIPADQLGQLARCVTASFRTQLIKYKEGEIKVYRSEERTPANLLAQIYKPNKTDPNSVPIELNTALINEIVEAQRAIEQEQAEQQLAIERQAQEKQWKDDDNLIAEHAFESIELGKAYIKLYYSWILRKYVEVGSLPQDLQGRVSQREDEYEPVDMAPLKEANQKRMATQQLKEENRLAALKQKEEMKLAEAAAKLAESKLNVVKDDPEPKELPAEPMEKKLLSQKNLIYGGATFVALILISFIFGGGKTSPKSNPRLTSRIHKKTKPKTKTKVTKVLTATPSSKTGVKSTTASKSIPKEKSSAGTISLEAHKATRKAKPIPSVKKVPQTKATLTTRPVPNAEIVTQAKLDKTANISAKQVSKTKSTVDSMINTKTKPLTKAKLKRRPSQH